MKKSKLFFLLLLCGTFSATAQRTALQKLEHQWKTSPNPNRLAALSKACQDQAWWFFKRPQFNNDSTLFYFDKALALLENAQPVPNELLAALYDDLSQYRLFRSEYGLAAKMGAKALSFFKKTNKDRQDKMLHYNILRDYALAELDMGNGKYALDLFKKSAILFQNETDPATLAMLWKDKGIFYSRFSNGIGEEIKQVLNSFQKSAAFYENSSRENPAVLADIYEELAWSYNMRESYEPSKAMADSCDLYYTKLHDILPLVQNPILDARYYGQWGNKLFRRGRFDEALHYAQMSQRIMDTFQLQYHQNNMFVLNVLGTIALEKQQWEQAEAYFTKSRDVGRQQHSSNEYTYLLHMRTLYERKGDYKNALLMSDLSWEEEINLNEKLSQKNLQESELQLNVLRQEQELSKKNAERRILIAAILIALFLMGLLSLIFLKERRSKAKLAQQNQIIENQTQALRQLDTAKSRFFANVSHELRTPLTLMLAPLSTALKSKTLDDKNTTLVSLAQQNATQLLGLVNEILDLTKLESGKMAVHEEPTPVYPFLRRLVATFESYAAQKNIKLIIGFDPDMPPGLMLDKAKIERIVNNLLSNALKFTPKDGSITIKASHTTAHWQLSVSDTGRGIHPDDLPEVFNRFYQTKRSDMPVEGGTGIGLALAKELAQAMSGMLSAESTYGEGATFTLVLPKQEVLGLSQEQSAETEANALVFNGSMFLEQADVPATSNPQNGERATIMVVEDNPSLRAYLKLILSDTYKVLTAEDGQAALAILADDEQPTPNLIISDIMMPVMDGFQLLEQLKADKNRQFIPVMMLTARAEMQDRLKALRIGVDDYLTKPFDEAELFARMRNLLNNAALRQQFQSEMELEMGPETMQEQAQNQLSPDNLAWLAEVEATVRRNIGNSYLSIDFIADEIHLSRAQFYRRLQALTGLTPNQYLQEILFNHARQLLEQRRVGSVKAAAAAIGIHTVQYFSEQFKARFGKLPSAYL